MINSTGGNTYTNNITNPINTNNTENTMVDFSTLKKSAGKKSLESLAEELKKFSSKQQPEQDDRFWYPSVDKAGNGYAVIRFLPPNGGEDEDTPFVRLYSHGFQGPTSSWYIENSLTTLGKRDPVSEYNSKLWNSGVESDKGIARKQKRKLTFISNIYVITDQQNPENEGKVFLFKYGKKIFDKLKEAMEPEFSDEEPMNPFDMWHGANFKLKIRNVEGYRNYDKSEFADVGPLFEDDDKIKTVFEKGYPLKPFIAPDQFKTYEELQERLNLVLGINRDGTVEPKAARTRAAQTNTSIDDEEDLPPRQKAAAPKTAAEEDEDDESMEFFKKLANG
jgi:hypothetical protein